MTRVEGFKTLHGQVVPQIIINDIKREYKLSRHSIEQLMSRSDLIKVSLDGEVDVPETKANINNAIDNNILAYFNTDGSINIALNEWNYFIFAYDEVKHHWTLITYKEENWHGKTIFDKRQMALDGYDRKNK